MKKLTVLIMMIMLVLTACGKAPTGAVAGTKESIKMDLYVMSQCPYGVMTEMEAAQAKQELGEIFELNIEYIGASKDGKFASLHGESEIIGDKIQLCVKELHPDKMINFIVCQNNNDPTDLTKSIDKCANETGIDAAQIKECYEGEKGNELLTASFAKAEQGNIQASPTIIINGKEHTGNRDKLSLMRAVCGYTDNAKCADIPECATDFDCTEQEDKEGFCENPDTKEAKCTYKEPAEFEVIIINDKRCDSCDATEIEAVFKQAFIGANIKKLDVSEAQELIEANQITKAPAVLIAKGITESKMWKNNERMKDAFVETDYGYKLSDESIGASYTIDEEARTKELEKLGITPGDNKPQIDFFVMSYCPYGNQAEEALMPAFELLGDSAEWKPHYVIYSNYRDQSFCFDEEQKYCSMHGLVELNQGLRELCVKELYGIEAWFKFAIEMNTKADYKNADEKWEEVAKGLGYDTEKIKKCFDEKALEFLEAELALNKAFGATGSPAVFIDGKKYDGARTPKDYATAICAAFDEAPEKCGQAAALESTSAPAAGGCGV